MGQPRSPYWWTTRIKMLEHKGVSRDICRDIRAAEDESLLLSLLYAPRDHIQRLNELDARSRDDGSRSRRDVPWVSRRSLPCRWRLHRLCKGDCICWCHR